MAYREQIDEIKDAIFDEFEKGTTTAQSICRFIADSTGMTERSARNWYHKLYDEFTSANSTSSEYHSSATYDYNSQMLDSLKANTHKDVFFNEHTNTWVINLRSKGNVLYSDDELHQMLEAYSNFDKEPASINEVCRRFEISRRDFTDIKQKLGWTHDSLPITATDLITKGEDDIVGDLQQKALHGIEQRYRREKWKDTEHKAHKWELFTRNELNPWDAYLDKLSVKILPEITPPTVSTGAKSRSLVVGCTDWQIGQKTNPDLTVKGRRYNVEIAKKCVESFAQQVADDVGSTQHSFDECIVFLGGDIGHGLRGMTAKGTNLGYKSMDVVEYEQFDAIIDTLVMFITQMARIFPKVKIKSIRGNHLGFDWYPIIRLIEAMFVNSKNIEFEISLSRTIEFRVRDVLFVGDHGASADYKTDIPRGGKPRESWIQSLLLNIAENKPELFMNAKQKVFVQGDKHTFEHHEYNDFEFFMFGALPLGDHYADEHNLHSKSRQNALVVDNTGIKEVKHYYF